MFGVSEVCQLPWPPEPTRTKAQRRRPEQVCRSGLSWKGSGLQIQLMRDVLMRSARQVTISKKALNWVLPEDPWAGKSRRRDVGGLDHRFWCDFHDTSHARCFTLASKAAKPWEDLLA